MAAAKEVVITGIGVVSPIGIGRGPFWTSLCEGHSGVGYLSQFRPGELPISVGAEVLDFDPKQYIQPRKSLKVMSRDIQLGVAAANLAIADAGPARASVEPERAGVVFGTDMIQPDPEEVASAFRASMVDGRFRLDRWGEAMSEIFPLWLLKRLPNMPACHIAIAHDARGPINSPTLGEVSSLLAVAEAARIIERDDADLMIAGGTGGMVHPTILVRSSVAEASPRSDNPESISCPFDAGRSGFVSGEGACAFILESRKAAERRGASVLARIVASASRFEARGRGLPLEGHAIRGGIGDILRKARIEPREVGHVNAHGLSTQRDDRIEATAIREVLGDVPVTALKSFFGNLGSGSGAVEMAASVLALVTGTVPMTLNYERPDPDCPVNVVRDGPRSGTQPTALMLNHTPMGQAAALLIAAP